MEAFKDKVVFITGAASGIGAATARRFAQAGARVVVSDVNQAEGKSVVREIKKSGGKAHFVKCDVSRSSDVQRAIETCVKTFGGLDFAFNNAGVEGRMEPLAECSEAEWERVTSVNLTGVWLCMKYELREMLKRGGGAIVNCASVAGQIGFSGAGAYVASKHGVLGLTQAAALENARNGVRVNAVCPGFIDTPMLERAALTAPEMLAQLTAAQPTGRLGRPEEIAEAVLWLCSPGASFVIGTAIFVDGAWTAQ